MLNYSSHFVLLHFCKNLCSLNFQLIFVVLVFPVLFLEVNHTAVNIAKCQDNLKVNKNKKNLTEMYKQLIKINVDVL